MNIYMKELDNLINQLVFDAQINGATYKVAILYVDNNIIDTALGHAIKREAQNKINKIALNKRINLNIIED